MTPEDRAKYFLHWLQSTLLPGEPLWHRCYGALVPTFTLAKAWAGVSALGKSLRDEAAGKGALRMLAECGAVVALDSIVDDAALSAADAVWRRAPAPGYPPFALHGMMVGLTPARLVLLGIARSQHTETFDSRYAPLTVASLPPQRVRDSRIRVKSQRFVKHVAVYLSIGEGAEEQTFEIQEGFAPGNFAQGQAIEQRLQSLS